MDTKKNPWTILKTQEVYQNPWIKVTHHDVITPNGGNGIYGMVHFKNLTVAVLALDKDLNTWLVGQYRLPINQYSWELPQGGGPIGIDPLESAKRELIEEVGVQADTWKELLRIHTTNSVTDEYGITYVATNVSEVMAQPDDTEMIQIRKLPFEEVVNMVMRGEITEAVSISTILKTKYLLDRHQI